MSLVAAGLLSVASPSFADDFADVDRLFGSGQLGEALQRADQALAARPADARMRFLKGLILSEQGKSAEAIDLFNKLAADHPELPEPHNNLAVLYSKQGQYDQARRALESAIRTNPSYATAYENLGDVYAKLASQAYSKALQIDGNNAKVPPKLSMIRELFSPHLAGRTVATANTGNRPPVGTPARPVAPPPAVAVAPPPTVAVAPTPAPKPPVVSAPVSPPTVAVAPAVPAKPAAKPPVAANDTTGPIAAAQAWASAWSRKDLNGYFAAYTRDFTGGKSRKAWEDERRARIAGKRSISVALSDFDITVKGDRATVQFQQAYRADGLKIDSRKRLEMVRVSGNWLIQKESAGT